MSAVRDFSGTVEGRAEGLGGITLRYYFCAAVQMEIAFQVIEGLIDVSSARKRVPLLHEPIMGVIFFLG